MKNKLITFLVVISTAFITVNTFAFLNTGYFPTSLKEAATYGNQEKTKEFLAIINKRLKNEKRKLL